MRFRIGHLVLLWTVVVLHFSCSQQGSNASESMQDTLVGDGILQDTSAMQDSLQSNEGSTDPGDPVSSQLPGKSIPLFNGFEIKEKRVHVDANEELDNPERDDTFSVFIPGKLLGEIRFDSVVYQKLNLTSKDYEQDVLKEVLMCFEVKEFIVAQLWTTLEGYEPIRMDRILIKNKGKTIWNHATGRYPSCEYDSSELRGIALKEGKYYLVIEHSMNDLSLIPVVDQPDDSNPFPSLFTDNYDPNTDFRL